MNSVSDANTLSKRDQCVIWHPYTQHKTDPLAQVITRAKDALLYSAEGRVIIDAISSWWVTLHGHAHPYIAESIGRQCLELEQVIFSGFTHRPAVTLAERLLTHLPKNQSRLFYSDNGSTAVEVALKIALQYWHNRGAPRRRIVSFKNCYHGDTFGAMAAGADSAYVVPFRGHLFQVDQIDLPSDETGSESVRQLAALLATGEVAAFIFEPILLGAGGMRNYPPAALDRLLALCRTHAVLTIADEVMTGFYRTGTFFAMDQMREEPDMICLSKGITGGTLPLAVTSVTEELFNAFYDDQRQKMLLHGHSYTANPIACAAALASLDLTESKECSAQVRRIEDQHRAFLSTLTQFPFVHNSRVCGTVVAFEINIEPHASGYFNAIRNFLYDQCLARDVLLRPLGNTLYVLPPYCITKEQLAKVYDTIIGVLTVLAEHGE